MSYTLKYKDQHIGALLPNGDRYLVQLIDTEDVHVFQDEGSGEMHQLYVPNKNEMERGWVAAVILATGNGHRLETPDPAVVLDNHMEPGADPSQHKMQAIQSGGQFATEEHVVVRPPATVPMFFAIGQVVFIERLCGRQFSMNNKLYRIVNQVDILARWLNVNLVWDEGSRDFVTAEEAAVAKAAEKAERLLHSVPDEEIAHA